MTALQATFAALGASRTPPEFTALTRRFNASKIAGAPLGRLDFAFNTADAALMLVQYGLKGALCEHVGALAPNATDDERFDSLASTFSAPDLLWVSSLVRLPATLAAMALWILVGQSACHRCWSGRKL